MAPPRPFPMTRRAVGALLAAALAALSMPAPRAAAADVLTFEDLYTGSEGPIGGLLIPANYAGFQWLPGTGYITKYANPGSSYEIGTIGTVSIFSYAGLPMGMSSSTPFNFTGAYITGVGGAETVGVQGWQGGVLLYSQSVLASNTQALWFNFSFLGIDTPVFTTAVNYNTVVDNLTFNRPHDQIVPLYDQTKAVKSGATVPIKLAVLDPTGGTNISSSSLVVHATGLTLVSTSASGTLEDAGSSNPDADFRYDSTLDGYIFNLKTTGLSGTYRLAFTIGGQADPTYAVEFEVK